MLSFLNLTNFDAEIVAPSVKRVSSGVIELRRYQDGRMRMIFWPVAVALWVAALCSGRLFTGGTIHWALFPEHNVQAQYHYPEWEREQMAARKALSFEEFEEKEYASHLQYRGSLEQPHQEQKQRQEQEKEGHERMLWLAAMQEVLRKRYALEKPAISYEAFAEQAYQEFRQYRQEDKQKDRQERAESETRIAEEEANYRRIWLMTQTEKLQEQYKADQQERARLRQIPVTYAVFVQEKKEKNSAKRSEGRSDLYLLLVFSVLAIYPQGRPVRIDINRRLVYFRWWGKFYIYRYPVYPKLEQLPSHLHGFEQFVDDFQLRQVEYYATIKFGITIREEWLSMTIPSENPHQKPCTVSVGSYMFQAADPLASFLFYYVNQQLPDEALIAYLKQGRRRLWLSVQKNPLHMLFKYMHLLSEISLLPGWGYRGKATERKIRQWLQTHGGEALPLH